MENDIITILRRQDCDLKTLVKILNDKGFEDNTLIVENITFDYNFGNPCAINMDGVHLNGRGRLQYAKALIEIIEKNYYTALSE